MDDLTLIRDFRAERDDGDPRARAAARRDLEAKFEPSPSPTLDTRSARSPRRGFLALAGAAALAAIVAGILVLGAGQSAEPAAAEALHQTAAVAASGEGVPALHAGPGQYYLTTMRTVEFEGWIPGGETADGPITSRSGGYAGLLPTQTAYWASPEGGGRYRQTMGTPEFISSGERNRWEAAGSPLPLGFDPGHDPAALMEVPGRHYLEATRGVLDFEFAGPGSAPAEPYYPDLSGLPTDPKALRLAIQSGRAPGIGEPGEKPLGPEETIGSLESLLTPTHPNAGPALRAAAFNALAEMPGFTLNSEAADLAGRPGYAISRLRENGTREEFIFDPATSRLLGERILLGQAANEPNWKGYEPGLTLRDVAYMQSQVVDSTSETEP